MIRCRLLLACWLFSLTPSAAAAAGIVHEKVFGPETPTGPYKHPASFTELDNGDLLLVYYGGAGEYANDTAIYGSRLRKGARKWTPPVVWAKDPFRSAGNPVIWQAPDGVVWLFYVVRFGPTWSDSRIQCKISRDRGRSWSDASLLALEAGMMVRGRPIVLSDGDYLLPVYQETGHDTEFVGPDSTSLFLRYDRRSGQWRQTGRIRSANGNIQPAVVEISANRLLAFCRRGGGYGPGSRGYIVRAESHDGGWTWTEGRDTEFPNPNAAIELIRLVSGKLLLVYNPSMSERTPLTAALSADGGNTFPWRRNIAEGPGDFAYPVALQSADGKIQVVYTSHRRTVINRAIFDEAWLMQP
ncbi:MAG: sialidase family protein [Bryobacterales bacterium]|nr:exo-alpha-sialidase [Bryobacteraceae bacterium]MDW8130248.1 sialidase family protein [Bryobacterales bacterium]